MKIITYHLLTAFMAGCGLAATLSCSQGNDDDVTPPDGRTPVSIVTRTEEAAELKAALIEAGLYMVNYTDEGQPADLLPTDNYVNNQRMTWSGDSWQTEQPIYWIDMDTSADFYAYAPYQQVDDARSLPFSVSTDQRTDESLTQSNLMWGRSTAVEPTTDGFSLTVAHMLSRLTVSVEPGAGFEDGELLPDDVSVTIGGTRTHATFDIQTGQLTVDTGRDAEPVTCHHDGNMTYTAILLPQQVPFSNLIQVNWKGNVYTLQNAFTLQSKRQYNLTVKLKKTKSGFDIGIDGWDILPEDFGGPIGG